MRSLWRRSPSRRRRVHRSRLALNLSRIRRSTAALGAVAALVATVTGVVAKSALDDATAARQRWGQLVTVATLVRDVPAGGEIDAADVRDERRPRALLPRAGPLRASEAVGRVAITDLVAGDVVVEPRVSSDLVPAGWLAIAVAPPGTGVHPEVALGDAVDVIDVATGGSPVSLVEGVVVATRAGDGAITVAVPADAAPLVAYAATAGTAVLAITATRQR